MTEVRDIAGNDLFLLFVSESKKLDKLIEKIKINTELSLSEIIEVYYQIINVSSLATILKTRIDDEDKNNSFLTTIQETEFMISKKFDSSLHHVVLEKLSISIQDTMKNLQSIDSVQKSKNEIEHEAKLYEELRQIMSTKEFVEQYDKRLRD